MYVKDVKSDIFDLILFHESHLYTCSSIIAFPHEQTNVESCFSFSSHTPDTCQLHIKSLQRVARRASKFFTDSLST